MLHRTLFVFLTISALSCHAGPRSSEILEAAKGIQCSVCQFLGVSLAMKNGNLDREKAVAHCQKFQGCEKPLTDCEIISAMHTELQKSPEFSEKSRLMVNNAAAKCPSDSKALFIGENVSSTECMLCFLVYDVLKYINYNILLNPMLGDVKLALEEACVILSEPLCQALLYPDTLGAIIRGLQDSLGSFYDLIGVQAFGCPQYTELFTKCPGH